MTKGARKMRLNDAIDRLASLYEYGALLACTDPAALLTQAADEIVGFRTRQAPSQTPEKP